MRRCLQLALLGEGCVAPNPLVGCVIVVDDAIIGEGYHRQFGGPHAEVEAISKVSDREQLKSSVLYVNLEPCAHHGKTPPCVDLIIRSGIPKVVVGMTDPNPLVAGKGIDRLHEAGIKVIKRVLEKESRFLNRRFVCQQELKRPYVILKWAESADGFMDIDRSNGVKGTHWITGPESRRLVHGWRASEAAIMVGANTVRNDNPKLTVREIEGKQPVRIILDPRCTIDATAHVISDGIKTIVINEMKNEIVSEQLQYLFQEDMRKNLPGVLNLLHNKGISSILVEGGRYTIIQFLEAGLFDEVRILKSPVELHQGLKAPQPGIQINEKFESGSDKVFVGFKNFG